MSKLYTFQLGTLKLMSISDGAFPVSKEFFFANTPEDIIQDIPPNFDAPLNFLHIDTGDKQILVDVGFGKTLSTAGQLLNHIKTQGIYPEDIDTIIITHAHMDHIGGLSNNGKPVFPNAEYIMRKEEWDFWENHPQSNECRKLKDVEDRITLITSDVEIFPGIYLIHAPGHTVGHLCLYIHSEGTSLLVASDILNDPRTLQYLPSHIRAEVSPRQGLETRRKFLQDTVDRKALVFACHYPFPGLGYVREESGRWEWIPIVLQND
ncbi:Glyoxylase, beta-lactamase superfamily II [Gracilibacillus orientalis]|uniref:Glyoxylase, beta-lactamase superfamily II n=1 Tax=Gracilibacillus orientalis TaxID=334253 RepID=A0A1I4NB89_9BACI|nr:MBL fold metallo-hydrolase [Gracilibacillus orientalis]SFM12761.1 Glyoxylase, beta-lactamase superfamily II [Gracilibacillus orientalis]